MQKVHFRLMSVPQKRRCLSSLLCRREARGRKNWMRPTRLRFFDYYCFYRITSWSLCEGERQNYLNALFFFPESSLPGLLDHLRQNWHRWPNLLLNHLHSSPLATLTRLAEDLDPALARLHYCWGMPWLICLEDQAKGKRNIIVLQFPSYHRQTT